jgi:hypothetical protein
MKNAAMRFLDAFGNAGAARGQLEKDHVLRIRAMNVSGFR